jgi:hypothetical protein
MEDMTNRLSLVGDSHCLFIVVSQTRRVR